MKKENSLTQAGFGYVKLLHQTRSMQLISGLGATSNHLDYKSPGKKNKKKKKASSKPRKLQGALVSTECHTIACARTLTLVLAVSVTLVLAVSAEEEEIQNEFIKQNPRFYKLLKDHATFTAVDRQNVVLKQGLIEISPALCLKADAEIRKSLIRVLAISADGEEIQEEFIKKHPRFYNLLKCLKQQEELKQDSKADPEMREDPCRKKVISWDDVVDKMVAKIYHFRIRESKDEKN